MTLDEFFDAPLQPAEKLIIEYAKTHDCIKYIRLKDLGFSLHDVHRCIYLGFLIISGSGLSKSYEYVNGPHIVNYPTEKEKKILGVIANGQSEILEIAHICGYKCVGFHATISNMMISGLPLRFKNRSKKYVVILTREG